MVAVLETRSDVVYSTSVQMVVVAAVLQVAGIGGNTALAMAHSLVLVIQVLVVQVLQYLVVVLAWDRESDLMDIFPVILCIAGLRWGSRAFPGGTAIWKPCRPPQGF